MSLPEAMLWTRLRGRSDGKPVFRRQHPLGAFVLDFFCPKAGLVVEIDGESHDTRLDQDRSRDDWLRAQGLDVIRYRAVDVLNDPGGAAEAIIREAELRLRRA
jgi:very-short-patch-repair endonuclease